MSQPADPSLATPAPAGEGYAIAGMVLGICSLAVPILGPLSIPCSLVGLPLSVIGLKSRYRGMALAGVICSSVGLVFFIVAVVFGVILIGFFSGLIKSIPPN